MKSGHSPRRRLAILAAGLTLLLSGCGQAMASPHATPRAPAARPKAARQVTARAPVPWATYGGDPRRWASYPEPQVKGLRLTWSTPALDGAVYAQPLWQGDLAYIATENDTVYAVSLKTGRTVWRRHLGTPVPLRDLPCGDIGPLGITGTPVLAGGRIYVAVELEPIQQRLFALSAKTGQVLGSWTLDLPGTHAYAQQQRGALSYLDGTVYAPLGGLYGDCGPYVGQVVAVHPGRATVAYRVPTAREGAIWAPAGLSLAANGDLYAATGNSASNSAWDGGDSVLRLSPALKLLGYFTPRTFAHLNQADLDLGSTAPLPLPGGFVFQIGKEGVGYLLRAASLGGIGHPVASGSVCSGAYGADAYGGGLVFVPCTNGLVALRPGSHGFSRVWSRDGWDAGPPAVGGGAVLSVDESGARLDVFSAATGRRLASVPLGAVPHFDAPALAPGLVLVDAGNRVKAFALVGQAAAGRAKTLR